MKKKPLWPVTRFPNLPVKLLAVLLYLIGAAVVWACRDAISASAGHVQMLSPVMQAALEHVFPAYLLVGGVGLVCLLSYPIGRKMAQDQFQNIGLLNHVGTAPRLLHKRGDKAHPNVVVWEFQNPSISLNVWEDRRQAIEAALDVAIVKLSYGKNKSRVLVYTVPSERELPEVLPWKNSYLSQESFVLALGESPLGPVTVNLAHIPHILLGGSTGSGKSLLLKLLLMQALHKGAEVYIADFKGGVDYPSQWRDCCRMCFHEEDLLETLDELVRELEARKEEWVETGCPNLDEYNQRAGRKLPRLIFACDEVAEVLDKTGRTREEKERLAQIENRLATIARQGRAFGIHLFLATQRPDATILPGQIRNNLDFRVCGRADSVLSQIILDNTTAAQLIPKDARGRFVTGDGTLFQAYLFHENSTLIPSKGA